MTSTLCICGGTCLLMVVAIMFFPRLTIGRLSLDTYWPIALLGAILLLLTGGTDIGAFWAALTSNEAINPLKIALLFLSMTVLSVFLDEVGFFGYVAVLALRRAGHSQRRLFFLLFAAVSVLTVFTSNDIVVLTFTPFICYFARAAKIDPLPYLVAEFVAANTFSMALVIGNPTNVYLAATYGIDFIAYLRVMLLPTLAAGLAAGAVLYLLFARRLRQPIEPMPIEMRFRDRLLLGIGFSHTGRPIVTTFYHQAAEAENVSGVELDTASAYAQLWQSMPQELLDQKFCFSGTHTRSSYAKLEIIRQTAPSGIQVTPLPLIPQMRYFELNYSHARHFFEELPDLLQYKVFWCASDLIAYALCDTLRSYNLTPGKDVMVQNPGTDAQVIPLSGTFHTC